MVSTKAAVVFIVILFFIICAAVWYGLNVDKKTESQAIPITPEQMKNINDCSVEKSLSEERETVVIESNQVCYQRKETKHNIVLLSSCPKTGSSIIRTVYETVTGIATYTQYADQSSHRPACDFQTGPWKLYCRANGTTTCNGQHPPPWHTPYLVDSNYPIRSIACKTFGYPLPRHEKVIHMIRNPVDNIEAWIYNDFKGMIDQFWTDSIVRQYAIQYQSWAEFWQTYHSENDNDVSFMWIRFEDFCACMRPATLKLLNFADAFQDPNLQKKLDEILSVNQCDYSSEIGRGLHRFSKSQLKSIEERLEVTIKQFGYSGLMSSFKDHIKDSTSSKAKADYHKKLWPLLSSHESHPSNEYCQNLLSVVWDWSNAL